MSDNKPWARKRKNRIKGTKLTEFRLQKKARTNPESEVTEVPAPAFYASLDISLSNPKTVSSHVK